MSSASEKEVIHPDLKKKRLVRDEVAKQISYLMSRPDRAVQFGKAEGPENNNSSRNSCAVIRNVQGSSAGAGSGEFHVYRALRRKEYSRIKRLNDLSKEGEEQEKFRERRSQILRKQEEKTLRNRNKRLKRQTKLRGKKIKDGKYKNKDPKDLLFSGGLREGHIHNSGENTQTPGVILQGLEESIQGSVENVEILGEDTQMSGEISQVLEENIQESVEM